MITVKPYNKLINNIIYIGLFIVLIFNSYFSFGQNRCSKLQIDEARHNYQIGRFSDVKSGIQPCLNQSGFSKELEIEAYRLLGLSAVVEDSLESARVYIRKLIDLAPYYQPGYEDPFNFRKLVIEEKTGSRPIQVTSVSKNAENIYEAPAQILVVTKDQMDKAGYRDLEEVFHDLPGFDISTTSGGTYSSIYQRGYRTANNNDRSLLLVDGIEDNDLWSNAIWLSRQYPLSGVKQLEVIHGPASTMYGANAFVGVYNLVSKTPDDLIPYASNFGLSGRVSYGSFNTKLLDVTSAFKKKDLSVMVTSRVFSSDEFDRSEHSDFDYLHTPNEVGAYENIVMNYDSTMAVNPYVVVQGDSVMYSEEGAIKARYLDSLGFKTNAPNGDVYYSNKTLDKYFSTKIGYKGLTLGIQHWSREEGLAWFADNVFAGTKNKNMWVPTQTLTYLKYEKDFSSTLNFSNLLLYKKHELDEKTGLAIAPGSYFKGSYTYEDLGKEVIPQWRYINYYLTSRQFRNESKVIYSKSDKFSIVSGIEARYSEIQENYVNQYDDRNDALIHNVLDFGVYSQANVNILSDLKGVLGGRLDYNKIDTDGGYGLQFNPRAVLVYTPGSWIMKTIYSEAFKDATNFDKYSVLPGVRDVPNPTLPPEKVRNKEFTIAYHTNNNSGVLQRTYVESGFFHTNYSGVIATVKNDDGLLQNMNAGALTIMGGHLLLDLGVGKKLNLKANYSYTLPNVIPLDSTGSLISDSLIRIGDIASNKFNIGAYYSITENIHWNVSLNYSDRRPTGSETSVSSNPLSEIDAFMVINTSVLYKMNNGLGVSLGVKNLLNTLWYVPGARGADGYQYASQIPQPGRNYHLSLRYDFN